MIFHHEVNTFDEAPPKHGNFQSSFTVPTWRDEDHDEAAAALSNLWVCLIYSPMLALVAERHHQATHFQR